MAESNMEDNVKLDTPVPTPQREVSQELQESLSEDHIMPSIEVPYTRTDIDMTERGSCVEETQAIDQEQDSMVPVPEDHDKHGDSVGYTQPDSQDHDHSMRSTQIEDMEQDYGLNGVQHMREEQELPSEEQVQDDDPDSLFIREERISRPSSRPRSMTMTAAHVPPPLTATHIPRSTFARIRSLQQKVKQNRQAANRTQPNQEPAPGTGTHLQSAIESGQRSLTQAEITSELEKADKEAVAKFKKNKQFYDNLRERQGGKLNFVQELEWFKIEKDEAARQSKHRRDLQKIGDDDGELDLFPELHAPSNDRDIESESDDDGPYADTGYDGPSRKRRKPEMPRKEAKRVSIQDAELESMRVALNAYNDRPTKKRKEKAGSHNSPTLRAPRGRGKSKPSSFRAAAKAPPKRVRKSAKDKRETERAVKQATSLFNSNVFHQQPAQDAPEQPGFKSRNKKDALKEMIASVPLEDKKSALSDKGALMAAIKDFDGHGSVKADGASMWLVKGMMTSLKAYQIMGSAFMRRRENAGEEPRGGLLADQMGLGKTLMMLANIVNGRPPRSETTKTTLLVASPALITQWAREITLHTNANLRVMKYSSGTRIDSNHAGEILQSHDIILTTYSEIMKSYPKNNPPIECQTAEQKMAWWKAVYQEQRGALHRMLFFRVVLDEAQAIKNHTSRTSIACRALMAKHKWALSGTPISNTLTELYPYFKFLGVPFTGSFQIFKHNYAAAGKTESTERLLVRLSQFMLRRTHGDEMFGAPILKLPQASQITMWCDFNSVERHVYDIVHKRFSNRLNEISRSGELEKSYNNILVMLLRLRQLACHILMLEHVMRDLLELEDLEKIREVVNNAAADSSSRQGRTIIAIRRQLEKQAADEAKRGPDLNQRSQSAEDNEQADEIDISENEATSNQTGGRNRMSSGKTFGKEYNFKPFLNSLTTGDNWKKAKQNAKCSACNCKPVNPSITSCGHLICRSCYDEAQLMAAEEEKENGNCKVCHSSLRWARDLENTELPAYTAPETRSRRRRHDQEVQRIEQEEIAEDWLKLNGGSVLPSAKSIAIKGQIMNWRKENPNVKIIIYTQFLAMIKILAKVCQEEGWRTEQYHGKLSHGARDKAIENFADDAEICVLLASLRCGGLGLNLTMASRVIVIDPWWNSAIEQQAFCRVYRFGQKQTTSLTRFCVNNTVDARLIKMQKEKQEQIDKVIDDKGATAKGMSIRDLMRLFGNIREDDGGKPFIMVDDPDSRGGFAAQKDDEGYADDI